MLDQRQLVLWTKMLGIAIIGGRGAAALPQAQQPRGDKKPNQK